MINTYINFLIKQSWAFKEKKKKLKKTETSDYASGRLKKIQDDNTFFDFINSYNLLANKTDDVWYLSIKDYITKENDNEEFSWNDFEVESLEYADTKEEEKKIKSFWENHLPLLLSVKESYAFIGIIISQQNKGKIVFGREPEYEDIEVIADSLEDFFKIHTDYIKKGKGPFFLKNFV